MHHLSVFRSSSILSSLGAAGGWRWTQWLHLSTVEGNARDSSPFLLHPGDGAAVLWRPRWLSSVSSAFVAVLVAVAGPSSVGFSSSVYFDSQQKDLRRRVVLHQRHFLPLVAQLFRSERTLRLLRVSKQRSVASAAAAGSPLPPHQHRRFVTTISSRDNTLSYVEFTAALLLVK